MNDSAPQKTALTTEGVRVKSKSCLKSGLLITGSLFWLGFSGHTLAMTDTDSDGVPDEVELAEGTDPAEPLNFLDSDGDEQADYIDIDSDGDNVPDVLEYGRNPYLDLDTDGIPAYLDDDDSDAAVGDVDGKVHVAFDPDGNNTAAFQDTVHNHEVDSDGDSVPDSIEIAEGTNEADAASFIDTDSDGLADFTDGEADNDGVEDLLEAGTYPYYDRDCDGVPAYLDDDDYSWQIGDIDNRVQILFDPDNDGVASFQDAAITNTDADGDQVPDAVEGAEGTDPADASSFNDFDQDGLPDFIDPDDDNDTIADIVEGDGDIDQDGQPNYQDLDSDADGINDQLEGTADANGDFIPNFLDPATTSTTPTGTDSDGDGISDAVEGQIDTDQDGTLNFQDLDSDGDLIPDSVEGNTDLDGDLVPNYIDLDSDNDAILDSVEGVVDTDGDSISNYLDTDSDADGIPDATETADDADGDSAGNYIDLDSDADTIVDSVELTGDPDADNRPNFLDDDSDGDGALDSVELLADADADGLPAYLDADEITVGTAPLSNIVETGVDGGCTYTAGSNRGPVDPGLLVLLMAGLMGVFRARKSVLK